MRRLGIGCAGIVGIVLLCGVVAVLGGSGRDSDHGAVAAYTICTQFVRDRLLAPRAAEFEGAIASDRAVRLGDRRWSVSSYVDAQNAFGAKIRTRWTCVVDDLGNGQWRLISLTTS
jgi:hypothetical protein